MAIGPPLKVIDFAILRDYFDQCMIVLMRDATVSIQVLGPLRVWRGGDEVDVGSGAQRVVLSLLVLAGGQPLSRSELVDALWATRPPASATNIIQTYVKHLRRLLSPEHRARDRHMFLHTVGDGYVLRMRSEKVDLDRFRVLIAKAADARRGGDRHLVASLLEEAFRLWKTPALADIPALAGHPRLVALDAERRAALARYSEAMIDVGRAVDALPVLESEAVVHPLDEGTQVRLIRSYHAAGHRAAAFRTYDAVRRRLVDELGVGPGPELVAAHAALLSEVTWVGEGSPVTRPSPAESAAGQSSAAPPVRVIPKQLPAAPSGFTGRIAELALLSTITPVPAVCGRAMDDGPEAAVVTVVTGTAGVGKTALAVRWAHKVRSSFPDGQLYVNLRGYDADQPVSAGDALSWFLTALGVPGQAVPADIDERAGRYRTEVADRRMLIVLDNAVSVEQVLPLLPGTASCVVLVTSRDSLAGLVILHGAHRLELDLLSLTEAIDLLHKLVGARVEIEPEAAKLLTEQCARLPLALRVAAELASTRPDATLSDLVRELADQRQRLDVLDAGEDARAAVRSVFSWSYRHLPVDAARVFRLSGIHPGPDLDPYAVAALADTSVEHATRVLRLLFRAHLIQRVGAGRFGMHDLLRAYAVDLAAVEDSEPDRRAVLSRLFDHYLAASTAAMDRLYPTQPHRWPATMPPGPAVPVLADAAAARCWLDAQRPVLAAVCRYAAAHGWLALAADLATRIYRYLEGGHYTEALAIHTDVLRAARQSGDDTALAHALTNIGAVYRLLGQYGPAAEHLHAAVALHRRIGDRHGEARALSNLGIIEDRLGRYGPAIDHQCRALALYREVGDRVGGASTLNNLASAYHTQGRYDLATEHYQQAMAGYRELGDQIGEAIALSNLGIVDTCLDQMTAATMHLRQALAMFRELGHRYGEAAALNNLGDVEVHLGRYEPAMEHQRQALAVFGELGHRYGEATALNGLGEALTGSGRPADALAQHSAALTVVTVTGDRDEQARAHAGLAAAHQALGDSDRTRHHLSSAIDLHTQLGSPDRERLGAWLAALDRPRPGEPAL
ncbi:AfsR/SARP family transcriptional regulator [Micromonospora echinospora]|uniref:AfsR/SARP family transcriptional regulator n=1 Tax=Micromonospora echinospora TaxID=1877 RepID=UPI0037BA1176